MCTAISYRKNDHYFGRNLDIEVSYQEQVVITPRNRLFRLKNGTEFHNTYALVGIATIMEDYPLYYEAANEAGLAAAGLNFVGNATYLEPKAGADNISPFELLPWILGQAQTVAQAKNLLERLNLSNIPFSDAVPLAPLHFMFSDKHESIVVEPMADGLKLYENPYNVMTNNPPFEYHCYNLNNYLNLSPKNGENRFSKQYPLPTCCVGMGAFGLPGDTSSPSRFVRAAFNLTNSDHADNEMENVAQVFHVLDSVSMLKGSTLTDGGKNDITRYSCCINVDQGIFYYKTYDNNQITAVRLHAADLNGDNLIVFPLRQEQAILYEN